MAKIYIASGYGHKKVKSSWPRADRVSGKSLFYATPSDPFPYCHPPEEDSGKKQRSSSDLTKKEEATIKAIGRIFAKRYGVLINADLSLGNQVKKLVMSLRWEYRFKK